MFGSVDEKTKEALKVTETLRTPPNMVEKMMTGAGQLLEKSNLPPLKQAQYTSRSGIVDHNQVGKTPEIIDEKASIYQCDKCKQLFFAFKKKKPGQYKDTPTSSGVLPFTTAGGDIRAICLHCYFSDHVANLLLTKEFYELKADHQIDESYLSLFFGYLVYCPEATQYELNAGLGEYIRSVYRQTERLAKEALTDSDQSKASDEMIYPGEVMPSEVMATFHQDFIGQLESEWFSSNSYDAYSAAAKKSLLVVPPEFQEWDKRRPKCADYLRDMIHDVAYKSEETRHCYFSESLQALKDMDDELRNSLLKQKHLRWMLPPAFVSYLYRSSSVFY